MDVNLGRREACVLRDAILLRQPFQQGDLLARRGRYAEAVEAWRRALAGDGEQIERPRIERKISDALSRLGKR